MRILGIDPGTIHMGYGIIDDAGSSLELLECGLFDAAPRLPIERRLLEIYEQLQAVLARTSPDAAAIEEPFVVQAPRRSALAVAEARAVAMLAATARDIPVFHYTPTKVRSTIANYGASDKEQVRMMVGLLLERPLDDLPLDASDALAVAICHSRHVALLAMTGAAAATSGKRVARR